MGCYNILEIVKMDSDPVCSKCSDPIDTRSYRAVRLGGGWCVVCNLSFCENCTKWTNYDVSPSTLIKYVDEKEFKLPKRIRIQAYAAPRQLCSVCSETNTVDELVKKAAIEWAEGQFEKRQ